MDYFWKGADLMMIHNNLKKVTRKNYSQKCLFYRKFKLFLIIFRMIPTTLNDYNP
jgi:hypothetical protein